jgi:hypothetical protein
MGVAGNPHGGQPPLFFFLLFSVFFLKKLYNYIIFI